MSLCDDPFILDLFYVLKANKNLDMSINASNNFNLNITWSVGSTGTFTYCNE